MKQEESKAGLRNWLESEVGGHVRYRAKARRTTSHMDRNLHAKNNEFSARESNQCFRTIIGQREREWIWGPVGVERELGNRGEDAHIWESARSG